MIFVLSDQHRWDAVGSKNPDIKTPHLDKLAGQGVSCENFFCSTQPCVPARATILTGRYHEEHGMGGNGTILGRYEKTWAGHLSEHGYQTVAVGRTQHIDKGFDHVIRVPSGESYPMNCHDPRMQQQWRTDAYIGPSDAPFDEYYEAKITKTAIDFLREMNRSEKPFALYVGFLQPHAAYTPPEPFWSMYKDLEVDVSDLGIASSPFYAVEKFECDDERKKNIVRGYYAMIACMDACVGMLMDEMEALGLAEDTLLVYTSDHGEMLGEKGLYGKGFGYEPSIRVPFIASCKGAIPANTQSLAMMSQVDIANTLCEALGVELMDGYGKSAWSNLTGKSKVHADWIYSTLGGGQVVRTEKYKWIHLAKDGVSFDELYNLLEDPTELHNLADTPVGRDVLFELYPKLLDHINAHFRRPITDFDPDAVQPELIPFFTA